MKTQKKYMRKKRAAQKKYSVRQRTSKSLRRKSRKNNVRKKNTRKKNTRKTTRKRRRRQRGGVLPYDFTAPPNPMLDEFLTKGGGNEMLERMKKTPNLFWVHADDIEEIGQNSQIMGGWNTPPTHAPNAKPITNINSAVDLRYWMSGDGGSAEWAGYGVYYENPFDGNFYIGDDGSKAIMAMIDKYNEMVAQVVASGKTRQQERIDKDFGITGRDFLKAQIKQADRGAAASAGSSAANASGGKKRKASNEVGSTMTQRSIGDMLRARPHKIAKMEEKRENARIKATNVRLLDGKYAEDKQMTTQMKDLRGAKPNFTGQECAICYEDCTLSTHTKLVPCGHIFHPGCIQQWYAHGGTTCPLCRQQITGETTVGGSENAADDGSEGGEGKWSVAAASARRKATSNQQAAAYRKQKADGGGGSDSSVSSGSE
jgi:hypothetical protein